MQNPGFKDDAIRFVWNLMAVATAAVGGKGGECDPVENKCPNGQVLPRLSDLLHLPVRTSLLLGCFALVHAQPRAIVHTPGVRRLEGQRQ